MGTVWDRTLDVIRGRMAILAGIALATVYVPGLLGPAYAAVTGQPADAGAVQGVIGIISAVLTMIGVLAMTAVATDPAVDGAQGLRLGAARLGPALANLIVLVIAFGVLFLPSIVALFAAGATVGVAGKVDVTGASGGLLMVSALLMIVALIVLLWFSARLVPLFAVIVNERRGLGAIPRSFALARGSALRLLGVIILFGIVLLVVMAAVGSVSGVIARLLLGGEAEAMVTLVVSLFVTLVTAAGTVVQTVFYAQFYAAALARDEAAAQLA
ncbi:MAG: hypothetical protein DI530_18090 [Sphingomonas sp.]|uniref:Glycerophosphoryl diester phosphodiesterase membrane domain-containing protein n=2 Tax=Sphingomonadaceae TaxID=41297 RepID=A0A2A4I902_9SPHN|nr:hypothetical protein COA07_05845 [Sphingomonas adhaesiva]PZU72568.1 MAG: hypothetical protein DI530_18090 [Sphingomonas sp.]